MGVCESPLHQVSYLSVWFCRLDRPNPYTEFAGPLTHLPLDNPLEPPYILSRHPPFCVGVERDGNIEANDECSHQGRCGRFTFREVMPGTRRSFLVGNANRRFITYQDAPGQNLCPEYKASKLAHCSTQSGRIPGKSRPERPQSRDI